MRVLTLEWFRHITHVCCQCQQLGKPVLCCFESGACFCGEGFTFLRFHSGSSSLSSISLAGACIHSWKRQLWNDFENPKLSKSSTCWLTIRMISIWLLYLWVICLIDYYIIWLSYNCYMIIICLEFGVYIRAYSWNSLVNSHLQNTRAPKMAGISLMPTLDTANINFKQAEGPVLAALLENVDIW